MRVVLLGPPGAGKGTQAKRLSQELKVAHISTGDLLRQNVKDKTQLGTEAEGYMNSGLLVPDELVGRILAERLNKPDVRKGFILDGYPRTLNQAKMLDGLLRAKNMPIETVVYLDSTDEVIIQRLGGRLVCASCGLNFHKVNMPPKKEGVCDACGGKLFQREDDREETVRKRLEVYKKEVSSLIEYYEKTGRLNRLDADLDAVVVLNQIIALAKENDSAKV